ncbi:putative transcription factor C2H2 family [Dioscorea sansibarensis]
MEGLFAEVATAGRVVETQRFNNIIYFLSRDSHIEHPHLIRVHHFHHNAVRLFDVKRWLAELRGQHMPELYSWSYKRRYKSGYVWQDLLKDQDIITPVSNNEYVLKGSLIQKDVQRTSLQLFSSTTTTITSQEKMQMELQEMVSPEEEKSLGCRVSPRKELIDRKKEVVKESTSKKEKKDKEEPFLHKNGSGRRIFRNLLSCREIKTDATAQKLAYQHARKSWTGYNGKQAEKVVPSSYKPLTEPNCSQCGKTFKPEKLHSHMKSCKAFKAHRKSTGNIDKLIFKTTTTTTDTHSSQHTQETQEPPTSFFLTH